jgi:pilus assembly protein CpaF
MPGQFWVNEPGRVFVARRGRSQLTTPTLAAGELADLVERMLRTSGSTDRHVDPIRGRDDARRLAAARGHPSDISRQHMAVNIRKFVLQAHSLDDLVGLGTLAPHAAGSWRPRWLRG